MKTYFIFTVLILIEIRSILTQDLTCQKFDFNDPEIISLFQPIATDRFIIKSYNESSITPFRSSSQHFLLTKVFNHSTIFDLNSVNLDITIKPTTIFKVACRLQLNGSTERNNIWVLYVNGINVIADISPIYPIANKWNVYESSTVFIRDAIPVHRVRATIRQRLNSGNSLAIEYFSVYDPQITDENCVPIGLITTTTTTTTPRPLANTCMKLDFSHPLIQSQLERCPLNSDFLPIKSYNESTIIPFRSSSQYFLSANVVNANLCLMSLLKVAINPTSIFKLACFLQVNGSTQLNQVIVSYHTDDGAGAGSFINPVVNEWNVYEYPIYDTLFRNGRVRIEARVNSGNALAIEYLHIYDPEITDENCEPVTIAPQICQWKPGQEIAIGNRCDAEDGYFVFQSDGNAVIYDGNNVPIWNTVTAGIGHTLVFEIDGNLVMYSNTGTAVWQSASLGGNLLQFQQDRNLVIYNTASTPAVALWNTRAVA